MLIYGTRYYFAHDKNEFQGQCSYCNRKVTLKSYTARKFDHLYFIPIIPHGKHRVLADCPNCHHVKYMEYDMWLKEREKDFTAIKERLAEHPDDPQNLIDGMVMSVKYMERSMYEQFSEGAFLAFSQNCEVMELTWMAAERFGDMDNARKALEACIAAGGSPEANLEWSRILQQQGRVNEARDFGILAIEGQAENMVGVVPGIAEGFMRTNNCDLAAELMRKLLQVAPMASKSRRVRQIVHKLNKSLAAEANIDIEVNFGARIGDWARSVALWGTLCLAILGFIYMLGCYAIGNFRTVYILNGTHQSAAVSIDGNKEITVKPLSYVRVTLPEGSHRFMARYDNRKKFNVTRNFTTPFLSRLVNAQPTYILNPDGMALVIKRSIAEMRNGACASPFLPGQWRAWPAIDFVFTKPPAKSDPGKKVLSLYHPAKDLNTLANDLDKLAGEDFVRHYLAKLRPWIDRKKTLATLQKKYRVRFTYQFMLVNGLRDPYSVILAGQDITLKPLSHMPIDIREQPLTLSCPDKSLHITARTIKVPKDFWTNGNNRNRLHIINPDRRAILMKLEVIYGNIDREPDLSIHGGEIFFSLPKIAYVFKEPPERGRTGSVCSQLVQLSESRYIRFLLSRLKEKPKFVETEIRRRLKYLPDDNIALALLRPTLGPVKYLAFLRQRLNVRPVMVNLHKRYQNFMEITDPKHDLTAEYEIYSQKEPANADLKYLLARVAPTSRIRLTLYEQAASAPNPCKHAITATLREYMSRGRFVEAQAFLRKKAPVIRTNRSLNTIQARLLAALGKHEELLAKNTVALKQNPLSFALAMQRLRLLVAMGKPAKAKDVIKSYMEKIKDKPHEELVEAEKYLKITLLQAQGKLTETAALMKSSNDPDIQYDAAIYTGQFAKALNLARKTNPHISYFLPLYIAASNKDKATASAAMHAAIKNLARSKRAKRLAAAWLSGKQKPAIDDVLELPLPIDDKLLIVTAIGIKEPTLRQACFTLANKLNFALDFPHWIIANRIKEFTEQ